MGLLAKAPEPNRKKLGPACWYERLSEVCDDDDMAKVDGWVATDSKELPHSDLAEHLNTVAAAAYEKAGIRSISAQAVSRHRAMRCRCGQAL